MRVELYDGATLVNTIEVDSLARATAMYPSYNLVVLDGLPRETHRALMSSEELMSLFTGDEVDALMESTHSEVQRLVRRLTSRSVMIDSSGDLYQNSLELLRTQGLIDQARADELSLGYPVNFVRIT